MKIIRAMAACLLAAACAPALAQTDAPAQYCGDLSNAFGPFDYRKGKGEYKENLFLVESAHFTSDIRLGIRGRSGKLGGELDYTLRAFPNHAQALTTLQSLALKNKVVQLDGGRYPVECYFNRALRFVSDDPAVYAVYAGYLFALGRTAEALKHYITAVELKPDDPTLQYNLGLAYLKAGKPALANVHAQQAYALGFPLPGLKNALVQAKHWDPSKAPPPAPAPEAAAEPDAAAPDAAKPPAAEEQGRK